MIRTVITRSSKNMFIYLFWMFWTLTLVVPPNVAWMPSAAFSAKGCVPECVVSVVSRTGLVGWPTLDIRQTNGAIGWSDGSPEPGTEQRAKEATHGPEGEGVGLRCDVFRFERSVHLKGLHMCPVLQIECEAAKQAEAVQEQLRLQFEQISEPSGSKRSVQKLAKAPVLLVPERVSCGCKSSQRLRICLKQFYLHLDCYVLAGCGQEKTQAHPKKARFVATFAVLSWTSAGDPWSFVATCDDQFPAHFLWQGAKKEGRTEGEEPVTVVTAKCKEPEIPEPKPKEPKESKEKAVFVQHVESHWEQSNAEICRVTHWVPGSIFESIVLPRWMQMVLMLRFLWDYVWCRVNAPNLPIWLISDTASAEWWLKRKTNEQNKCHSVICEVSWSRRYMATYGDIESFQSAQASQAKRKVDVKKPSMEGMQGIQSICSQSPSGKSLKRLSNTQSEKKSQKAMVLWCFVFQIQTLVDPGGSCWLFSAVMVRVSYIPTEPQLRST